MKKILGGITIGVFSIFAALAYAGSARVVEVNNLNGLPSITISNGGGTVLLPTISTTLVGKQTTDQLDNKSLSLTSNTISSTASRVAEFGAGGALGASSTVDTTELGRLDGLTSAIVSVSGAQNLYEKSLSLTSNTISSTASRVAEFSASGELEASSVVDLNELNKLDGLGSLAVGVNDPQTLTAKTVSITSNTLTGTASRALVTDASGIVSVTLSLPTSLGGTGSTSVTGAFNNLSPLTTKGDLIIHDGGSNVRFPVGTDGQVLTANSAATTGVTFAPIPQPTYTPGYVLISQAGTGSVTIDGGGLTYDAANNRLAVGGITTATYALQARRTTTGHVIALDGISTVGGENTLAFTRDDNSGVMAYIGTNVQSEGVGNRAQLRAYVEGDEKIRARVNTETSQLYGPWQVNGNLSVTGTSTHRTTQYTLSVSGTGWTTSRAVGIKYQTDTGGWRLKFNIEGTVTSSSRTNYTVTISGVAFKTVSPHQACFGMSNQIVEMVGGECISGTGDITAYHNTATTTAYRFQGDVECDSEPSL